MSPTAGYLLETFVTLLAVAAVVVVVLVGARRMGLGAPSGPLELVGRLPLGPRREVYLVRVGEQVLVLAGSEAGLTKVSEMRRADLPAVEPAKDRTFASVLRRLGSPEKAEQPEKPGKREKEAPREEE